jgi:hypothetical protein
VNVIACNRFVSSTLVPCMFQYDAQEQMSTLVLSIVEVPFLG